MSGSLLHPPQRILQQLMINLGLAAAPGGTWPCYVGNMPDTPDNCVATHDVAGKLEAKLMHGAIVQKYGVQVKVRSSGPVDGYVKVNAIEVALAAVHNAQVNVEDESGTSSSNYQVNAISQTSPILKLGPEQPQTRRYLWTWNGTLSLLLV